MISFDQVLLLEEKVESAVKKIEQLNAENAALRSKVAELSNALNAKSEQFSSFQSDQSKIEQGILKALDRLNAVETVVIKTATVPQQQAVQASSIISQPQTVSEPETQEPLSEPVPTFDDMTLSDNQPEESPDERSLPEEVEIPVQSEIPDTEPAGQESQNPENFAAGTPDIAFDFGDSNQNQRSEFQPEPQQPEQPQFQPEPEFSQEAQQTISQPSDLQNPQSPEDSSIEPKALFDIF